MTVRFVEVRLFALSEREGQPCCRAAGPTHNSIRFVGRAFRRDMRAAQSSGALAPEAPGGRI